MAPLNPEQRRLALSRPGASEALLDEFENLISQFFMLDPSMVTVEEELSRFKRIQELHAIFFPGKELKLSPVKSEATS